MYDITSSCADDFINHEEILDTLAYADQNKENSTLIVTPGSLRASCLSDPGKK